MAFFLVVSGCGVWVEMWCGVHHKEGPDLHSKRPYGEELKPEEVGLFRSVGETISPVCRILYVQQMLEKSLEAQAESALNRAE